MGQYLFNAFLLQEATNKLPAGTSGQAGQRKEYSRAVAQTSGSQVRRSNDPFMGVTWDHLHI